MSRPFDPSLIPRTRRGVEVLLEAADFDLELLSCEQLQSIRKLYFLDDARPFAELIRAGKVRQ